MKRELGIFMCVFFCFCMVGSVYAGGQDTVVPYDGKGDDGVMHATMKAQAYQEEHQYREENQQQERLMHREKVTEENGIMMSPDAGAPDDVFSPGGFGIDEESPEEVQGEDVFSPGGFGIEDEGMMKQNEWANQNNSGHLLGRPVGSGGKGRGPRG